MINPLYAAIPIVMDRFDFRRVERVMTFLNWRWAYQGRVPTLDELESEAYRQLHQCVAEFEKRGNPKSGMNIASGGFQATIVCFESGKPQLKLTFYVDSVSSTGEF